jgi:hypothetical protein
MQDMSSDGAPIQESSDTVGHKSTHVTETVYRHVIVPEIRGRRHQSRLAGFFLGSVSARLRRLLPEADVREVPTS